MFCYKFVSPGNAGVPDRMFVGPTGRVAFLEFKQPGKKPTALQKHELAKLQRRNVSVGWVDSAQGAINFLICEILT